MMLDIKNHVTKRWLLGASRASVTEVADRAPATPARPRGEWHWREIGRDNPIRTDYVWEVGPPRGTP